METLLETQPSSTIKPEHAASLLGAEFLAPDDLARELGISPRTLHRWHTERAGPPRVVVGRTILYRRASVLSWLESLEKEVARPKRGRG